MPEFVHDLQVSGDGAVWRPTGLRAGFHAEVRRSPSGLWHAGEQWAPARFLIKQHTHPVWELYLQLHGLSRWTAAGRQFTLGPGHLLGIAPHTVHHMAEETTANHHFCFAAIDPAVVMARHPALAPRWAPVPATLHRPDAQSLADPFDHLMRELTARRRYRDEALGLAVDLLVLEVTRLLTSGPHPTSELAVHPAVARVRALLDRDYPRRWTLAELADRVGLAPTYLAGLFVRDVGMPPHRYLNERRIARARHLLRASDLSVTAIGVEVGFSSGQHFARVFRQICRVTPGAYRRAG